MSLALEGMGVTLAADAWGPDDGPPLLLMHGGGQTRGSWSGAGPVLGELGWRVLALDARGHGDSDWAPDGRYDIDAFAGDVVALARELDEPPVLVGASLGGISAIVAAGELGAPARAVVLVDIAHRAEPSGVQNVVDFMEGAPEGFATIEEAAEAVSNYLPHRPPPDDLDGLRKNLRRRGDRWVWHWDPRFMNDLNRDRHARDAEGMLAAARAIEVPILVVRGATSDVLSEEIAAEFAAEVEGTELAEVAAAGHMVAGDRNDRFLAAVLPFLERL